MNEMTSEQYEKQTLFNTAWRGGSPLNSFPQTDFEEKLDMCTVLNGHFRYIALRKIASDYQLVIPNGEI